MSLLHFYHRHTSLAFHHVLSEYWDRFLTNLHPIIFCIPKFILPIPSLRIKTHIFIMVYRRPSDLAPVNFFSIIFYPFPLPPPASATWYTSSSLNSSFFHFLCENLLHFPPLLTHHQITSIKHLKHNLKDISSGNREDFLPTLPPKTKSASSVKYPHR